MTQPHAPITRISVVDETIYNKVASWPNLAMSPGIVQDKKKYLQPLIINIESSHNLLTNYFDAAQSSTNLFASAMLTLYFSTQSAHLCMSSMQFLLNNSLCHALFTILTYLLQNHPLLSHLRILYFLSRLFFTLTHTLLFFTDQSFLYHKLVLKSLYHTSI